VAAITIRQLIVRRGGREVLRSLDLDIATGRITGLLGPSGSGKTTLMRAIVGVQIVESGTVTVLDAPAGSPELRPRVGYLTQAPSVYADLTVSENLAYFGRILHAPARRIAELLDAVDMTPHAGTVVSRLSGGERARVSLATAMLGHPALLVLDEPTVGLDPVLRNDLWALFRRLADDGTTLLVSSHVMDEAERCDTLILMREGAVLATGAPGELKTRTGTADVESAFLALVAGT
jgi:ABC-2 type transport system ATP-binding protein